MKQKTNFLAKLLSLLLVLCMAATLPCMAMAAGNEVIASGTEDTYAWVLTSDGTLTISGTKMPTEGGMYNAWTPWYDQRYDILNVVIEPGMTNIGGCMFHSCSNLTSVTIPDSVTSIENYAFLGCRSLTSITIPSSVKSIGNGAFADCDSLRDIVLSEGNQNFCVVDGILYSKDVTELIAVPGAISGSVEIPDGVTTIRQHSFLGSGVTSVTIPSGVTSIDYGVFSSCKNLTSVVIPEGVTDIGEEAFAWCEALTNVSLPDSLTNIGAVAFYDCTSLTSITIPSGVTSIEEVAFGITGLTKIVFQGNAPEFRADIRGDRHQFGRVTANVYYPAGNPTWTAENMLDYGGELTWIPYDVEEPTPTEPTPTDPQPTEPAPTASQPTKPAENPSTGSTTLLPLVLLLLAAALTLVCAIKRKQM